MLIFTKSTTYLATRLLDFLLNVNVFVLWNLFFYNLYELSSVWWSVSHDKETKLFPKLEEGTY